MSLSFAQKMEKGLPFFFLFAFFLLFMSAQGISAQREDAETEVSAAQKHGTAITKALGTDKDDHMDKETVSLEVSTVDQKDWYDDRCTNGLDDDGDGKKDGYDSDCDGGATGLRPNLFCDASADVNGGNIEPYPTDLSYAPCDQDGVHDDYYSTSATSENDVWTSDKNFTIRVKASDASGIDSIRIEWISGVNKDRNAASYWDPAALENYKKLDTALNPHLTSHTCRPDADGVAECEVCVVGGNCDNPIIPTGDLGISGSQQIIFMRAIVTDGEMNSVATGFDETEVTPVLDKFYRFVVCSTNCNSNPEKCKNTNPEVSLLGQSVSLACDQPVYTLKWLYKDGKEDPFYIPTSSSNSVKKENRPSSYILEVRNKNNPGEIYSAVRTAPDGLPCESVCSACKGYSTECQMSAVLFDGFLHASDGTPKNIDYDNTTYEWRVRVYDSSEEKYCLGVSEWSKWSSAYGPGVSFTTPHPAPAVSFSMTNGSGKDCSTGTCAFGENITFTSTSTTDPATSIVSYDWNIDGKKYGNTNSSWVAETFASGEKHTVSLGVTDRQGITCSAQKEISLGAIEEEGQDDEGNAGWDEIAPR